MTHDLSSQVRRLASIVTVYFTSRSQIAAVISNRHPGPISLHQSVTLPCLRCRLLALSLAQPLLLEPGFGPLVKVGLAPAAFIGVIEFLHKVADTAILVQGFL